MLLKYRDFFMVSRVHLSFWALPRRVKTTLFKLVLSPRGQAIRCKSVAFVPPASGLSTAILSAG